MAPSSTNLTEAMAPVTHIHVGRDFNNAPGGRYLTDGEGNATDFRTRFLVPVIERREHAVVLLDGVAGFPSSFLEEAFGGLVRLGYSPEVIRQTFEFRTSEPGFDRFIPLIQEHIDRAARRSMH